MKKDKLNKAARGLKLSAVVLLAFILSIFAASAALAADSDWEITIDNSCLSGRFDYLLHWGSDSSPLISKVSLPQNQNMVILCGKYHIPDSSFFVQLQYGDTGIGTKGRGSDSDWNDPTDKSRLYCYGDMDSYGGQKLYSIDLGTTLFENAHNKTIAFWGWGKLESSNELRNVIYHLDHGHDLGNQTQPDSGSSLNSDYSGFYIGATDEIRLRSSLELNFGVTLYDFNTTAFGHWASNNVGDWVDSGGIALGVMIKAGIAYKFSQHFTGQLGYSYFYAEADDMTEVSNGSILSQAVDLKYELQGLYFNIRYLF